MTNPPRPLFLSHTGALGGAELSMVEIAHHYRDTATFVLFEDGPFRTRLHNRGVTVHVEPAASELLGIQRETGLVRALQAIPELVRLAFRLVPLARQHNIIYAASQKALIVGGLLGLLTQRPVLWHLHDLMSAEHFSRLNQWVSVQLANGLTERIIVNSKASRVAFIESGGRPDRVDVVYYGLDPARFDRVNGDQPIARDLGLSGDPSLVGVFSRLAPWKGQHVLIQALSMLPGVHAVLVGDALFDSDVTYKDELHRLAETLEVADRVHFLGFRDDVPALMKAVDVVLHTSTAPEPFGRVIVEGMLARKPVIATRAGGAQEIVTHGETGLLVSPSSPNALARALQTLTADPGHAATLAQHGYEQATRRFSIDAMTEQLDRCLQEITD